MYKLRTCINFVYGYSDFAKVKYIYILLKGTKLFKILR